MRRLGFVVVPLWFLGTSCDRQTLMLLPEPGQLDAAVGAAADAQNFDGPQDFDLPCTQSGDCGSFRPHCDVSTQECVECLTALHCNEPETCELSTHRCAIPCTSERDCIRDWEPRCNNDRGVCVQCLDDADCGSRSEPFCNPETGECEECLTDAHCQADAPHCDPRRHSCET